jgi:hypothetical protein
MKELIKRLLNEGLMDNTLMEDLESDFASIIPKLEARFSVNVVKPLGESSGIAYLTSDNRVLKITSSEGEIKISNKLMQNQNKHFPKIYKLSQITNNGWHVIIKEYIPEVGGEIKPLFTELESYVNEWLDYDDSDTWHLLSEKIMDTLGTGFEDFLMDAEPHLLKLYQDLIVMVEYVGPVVDNVVDIHEDNLGYKNNNFILFDY